MDAPRSKDSRWFTQEVIAHEPSLKAYLRSSFPAIRDVDDVVQTSYLRIWRQHAGAPIRSAKAFLFTVARRLALDHVRRDRRSPIESTDNLGGLAVAEPGASVAAAASRAERVQLLTEAIEALPRRCREVMVLRKLKFLSQREVAARLGITERSVEVQLNRALHRCREYLQRRGVEACFDDDL